MGSIFWGVFGSFIGSLVWYFALRKGNSLYNQHFIFKKIDGEVYDHFNMNDEKLKNYSVISFEPPNILKIKTLSPKKDDLDWTGRVTMNEFNPKSGEGTFEYLDRDLFGKIFIQIREDGSIFIRSTHLESTNTREVAYFMKPQANQKRTALKIKI